MQNTMMQATGMQATGMQTAPYKGQHHQQRHIALRIWETGEARVFQPMAHARYAKRRQWERSYLVQHIMGALLVVGTLMLMGN